MYNLAYVSPFPSEVRLSRQGRIPLHRLCVHDGGARRGHQQERGRNAPGCMPGHVHGDEGLLRRAGFLDAVAVLPSGFVEPGTRITYMKGEEDRLEQER